MKMIIKLVIVRLLSACILKYYNGIWGLKYNINQRRGGLFKEILVNIYERYLLKQGSWIGYESVIDEHTIFPHGIYGVFISNKARIGNNCVIFQQVTIGSNTVIDSKSKGSPVIGDNCYIGAGAKIIGGVTVGNNCRIGANCVVTENMPDNSVAVLPKIRIIQKQNLDNKFYIESNDGSLYCMYQ
jgi:serine O-acetyltransferase